MGKSYDLMVEGGIFFGSFLYQDYGEVIWSLVCDQVKEWRVVKKAEEKETEKKSEKFKYFYCF